MHLYYGLCLLLALGVNAAKFKVPEVLIEAISPKGFRVSIPHVDGISLFAFHGNLNKDIEELEGGQFSVDINEEENGRWTYSNRVKKLKIGDVINYWVYVDYFDGERKLGYTREGETFTVTQLIGASVTTTTSSPVTSSSGCVLTPTQVNGLSSCKGRLIFEENFERSINPKWTPEVKFASEPDNNFVIYHNRENNLRILNNQLHITPSLTENTFGTVGKQEYHLGTSCTGQIENIDCHRQIFSYLIIPPVTSAQITTKNNFSFRYGIIEIRAKLPEGDWIYPELYLKNKNDDYGPGLESGLIRIAFTPGNLDLSKTLYGGCVLGASTAARRRELKKVQSEKHWTSEYHNYQLIWKPDQITLMVDNITYGNIYPPEGGFANYATSVEIDSKISERWKQGTPLAPFDKEMYIVVGVGVGGRVFLEQGDTCIFWDYDSPKAEYQFNKAKNTWSTTWNDRSTLSVDYVKVWAL